LDLTNTEKEPLEIGGHDEGFEDGLLNFLKCGGLVGVADKELYSLSLDNKHKQQRLRYNVDSSLRCQIMLLSGRPTNTWSR
jgi:hypothetical protein